MKVQCNNLAEQVPQASKAIIISSNPQAPQEPVSYIGMDDGDDVNFILPLQHHSAVEAEKNG